MKIEHLAIWVKDLEGMRTFYEKYFGATAGAQYHNPKKDFTSYFLSFASGPRLEIMAKPQIPANANDVLEQFIGLNHFAVSVGSKAAVNALTVTLRADGYTVVGEPRTTGDGYYESVVFDPEQNRIEITV